MCPIEEFEETKGKRVENVGYMVDDLLFQGHLRKGGKKKMKKRRQRNTRGVLYIYNASKLKRHSTTQVTQCKIIRATLSLSFSFPLKTLVDPLPSAFHSIPHFPSLTCFNYLCLNMLGKLLCSRVRTSVPVIEDN